MRRRLLLTTSSVDALTIEDYMTVYALEDGLTVTFTGNQCEYCIDGSMNWVELPSGTPTPIINAGQTISFRAEAVVDYYAGIGEITISKKCNLLGNCMSLLYGDKGRFKKRVPNTAFQELFRGNETIIEVSQKFLPATDLGSNCYQLMFAYCTNLVTAPDILASQLSTQSCKSMFKNCASLVSAPKLPSKALATGCYNEMFYGCSALKYAPELPATILFDYCYYLMFSRCTSLVNPPQMYAEKLAKSCCYSMFSECSALETAPVLLATTLSANCYERMFYRCSALASVKMLATDISASGCLTNWLLGVASSGRFIKNIDATWDVVGASGVPEGWTIERAAA